MKPEHERATKIALSALGDRGFALAGGNALSAHGIGARESDDIDLFTNRMNDNVGETVEQLQSAFEEQGYSTTIKRQYPAHARIHVERGDDKVDIDLGKDYRSKPPVETELGPVLHVDDAVGSKVGSIYTRGEAKDFVDTNAALQAGYSTDQLMQLADAREASPMDRPMFAQLLDSAKHIPDEEYAKCGLNPEETAGLKSRMTAWANEIRTREANPDIDQSMRLLQTGHAMPGQGQSASSNGEAAQRRSPYEQGRGMGERGS
ncbi:nucleotidyl transferase AbiEii/AbiGii toxin family protein [Kribbella sp. NPDC026596]|uniref:nucleotidyl transferase AbiEii/AbiGii toxin family protein n=1 Tax=Kribbella sp. NPDC026596 TaxID=3155122 RepID=UPI0033F4DFD4